MTASIEAVGQKALSPPWWSSIEIGDFKIDILPFYGEQPLHDRPWGRGDSELRNWGNCYRFTCPEFSAIILVDSGMEPLGNMIDVLERSYAERGAVDFLLSCCFRFPEGYNRGLPHYFLTVPLNHLRYLYQHPKARGSMTHGPDGVVRACRAARCCYFLPYAHGFRGLSRSPQGVEGASQTEEDMLKTIANGLGRSKTKVVSWLPGDCANVDQHRVTMIRKTPKA
jgi:hypothetical protein